MLKRKPTPEALNNKGLIWKDGVLDEDAMIDRDFGPFDWDLGSHMAPPVITPSTLEALDALDRKSSPIGDVGAMAIKSATHTIGKNQL